MDRVGKKYRNTQDNNGKSPEIRLSVLIIQVDRIANSNSIAALFQFKGSLCNDCMVVSCITGNSATVFIMEQINFTCLISLSRINICYNTVRSKLYTFNRIRYKISAIVSNCLISPFSLIRTCFRASVIAIPFVISFLIRSP